MRLKLSFVIFFMTLPVTSYTQIIVQTNSTQTRAVIEMKNGDIKKGNVYGFIDRRGVSFVAGEWASGDKRANLTDNSFIYEGASGEREKIMSEDVNFVIITKEDGLDIKYLRVGVDKVKKSGEHKTLDRKIWLPVLQEGYVKVLGYRLYVNGMYSGNNIYFQKEGDEVVTKILDYTNVTTFNMFSIHGRAVNAMKVFFADCPAAIQYLNEQEENGGVKAHMKMTRKKHKKNKKELKKLPRNEQTEITRNQREEELIGYYFNALEFYNNNCLK